MLKTLVGGWGNTPGSLSFNTLWQTNNAGTSSSNQITWPTVSGGTYSCTVYWGDGTSSAITTYNDAAWTHTYPSAGTYLVRIAGTFTRISFNNGGDRLKLLNISQWGGFGFGSSTSAYFYGCSNLTITATDLPSLTGTTSFANAFNGCSKITLIPNMGAWNTSSITAMNSMFNGCTMFNSNISAWNTVAVTTMNAMFSGASSFNQPIGSWAVGSVVNMISLFSNCTSFNQSLNTWNMASVTQMSSIFLNCTSFNQPLNAWNTAIVTNMTSAFNGATSFNQQIGSWSIVSLTNGTNMFLGVTLSTTNYNQLLAGWGAQVAKTGITFNGGNSHYDTTSGGYNGTAGRAVLTGTYSWVITDGGTP